MELDPENLSRRGMLGSVVGLAGIGGAGWIGLSLTDPISGANPDVPDLEDEGWEEIADTEETRTRDAGPITVETETNTLRFRDQALIGDIRSRAVVAEYRGRTERKRLSEYDSKQFPDRVRVFSATHADVKPDVDDLPGGIGLKQILDRVAEQAKSEFESELEDAGLTDVEEEDSDTLEVDTGQQARVYSYSATYEFEGVDVDVGGQTVSLPSQDLDFAGKLAIWDANEYIIISAGAYPDQNYQKEVTQSGEYGRDVTASLDLELDPDDYEEETIELIEQVE